MTDDEGLDGRVLAGCADVLRVRRGSKVAADIIGDVDVALGAEATVPVRGIESAPERKPRRKLKLVRADGTVAREVNDVTLVGALAVRAEIETARADGPQVVLRCARCEAPIIRNKVGNTPRWCPACRRIVRRERRTAWAKANPEKARACVLASHSKNRDRYRDRLAKQNAKRDKAKMAEAARAYYAANKEACQAKNRAYRARKKAEREAAKKAAEVSK